MVRYRKIKVIYDLWDNKDKKQNIKKVNKKQKTAYVPSLLSSIEIPVEGASFNPSVESYSNYVNKIVQEETKILSKEKIYELDKILATSDKLATTNFSEESQIFGDAIKDSNVGLPDDEFFEVNENTEETKSVKKKTKRKTIKQKRDAKIRRGFEERRSLKNVKKKIEHQLNNLKSLTKTVRKEVNAHDNKIAQKRKKRMLNRFLSKKRLGAGEFSSFVEPVLLLDEISGSLRTTRQQSDILKERLNSFQKRNILPTPGNAKKSKVKSSLHYKTLEKRSSKAIVKGSLVI